jgi:hypothetical protein
MCTFEQIFPAASPIINIKVSVSDVGIPKAQNDSLH